MAWRGDGDYVEAARGGKRTWANLDTVHRWIREQGWNGSIQIDEAAFREGLPLRRALYSRAPEAPAPDSNAVSPSDSMPG